MAQRESQLPEGTDHIITGAMETGGTAGGGEGGNFVAAGQTDDTGGNAGNGAGNALREGLTTLKGQAGDRVRQLADDGKTRASDALDELSRVVEDAAASIDERLGEDAGSYARRAADGISTFASTLREREVEELYDDVRQFVRRSPAVAIGIAAAVGFTLVRLVKAGMPEAGDDETENNGRRRTARTGKRGRTDA
jgi:ElaB/YqjD/DUF883 family membrane-anchored ribosome-binding protein